VLDRCGRSGRPAAEQQDRHHGPGTRPEERQSRPRHGVARGRRRIDPMRADGSREIGWADGGIRRLWRAMRVGGDQSLGERHGGTWRTRRGGSGSAHVRGDRYAWKRRRRRDLARAATGPGRRLGRRPPDRDRLEPGVDRRASRHGWSRTEDRHSRLAGLLLRLGSDGRAGCGLCGHTSARRRRLGFDGRLGRPCRLRCRRGGRRGRRDRRCRSGRSG
jgi:hypothetical protein